MGEVSDLIEVEKLALTQCLFANIGLNGGGNMAKSGPKLVKQTEIEDVFGHLCRVSASRSLPFNTNTNLRRAEVSRVATRRERESGKERKEGS